jgi:hypothetical protein
MLFAILICSDQACAETFEAWGELEEFDHLTCEGCECVLQVIGVYEADPPTLERVRQGGSAPVELRAAA